MEQKYLRKKRKRTMSCALIRRAEKRLLRQSSLNITKARTNGMQQMFSKMRAWTLRKKRTRTRSCVSIRRAERHLQRKSSSNITKARTNGMQQIFTRANCCYLRAWIRPFSLLRIRIDGGSED